MDQYRGKVERILWQSNDSTNHWRLFVLSYEGGQVTCAGVIPGLKVGAEYAIDGQWVYRKGRHTFEVLNYEMVIPSDEEGIVGFLSLLRGIGDATARAIYKSFGAKTIEVLETDPQQLLTVKGISAKKLSKIVQDFAEKRGIEKLFRFLRDAGISSTSLALKIYREYGAQAIQQIQSNPYVLTEIDRVGFKTADMVATKLGFSLDSPFRLRAGLSYALQQAGREGHVYLQVPTLVNKTRDLLSTPEYIPSHAALESIIEELSQADSVLPIVIEEDRVYLRYLHSAEVAIAEKMAHRGNEILSNFDVNRFLDDYQQQHGKALHPAQEMAVIAGLTNQTAIITGGAGTGKSTVTHAVVRGWRQQGFHVLAMAPSGKAAKRLADCTGLPATTIHAGLEADGLSGFRRNRDNPLSCDALIIDEASMLGTWLFSKVLEALPPHARLLIVGDPYQLPSIEPGNVLNDLIQSGAIPTVALTHVFRQEAGSMISYCANQANAGKMPDLEPLDYGRAPQTDALFLRCDRDEIAGQILELCRSYLPALGYSQSDIYVNSPQNTGPIGNAELNRQLQDLWNPCQGDDVGGFRPGDRVLQIRNDRSRALQSGGHLVNGDLGIVASTNPVDREVEVIFYDTKFTYSGLEIQDLMLAYSLSVHRCQGSEFPVVIVPVSMSHYMMLQRNLIYTAMTRPRTRLILVGETRALETAIRRVDSTKRYTSLEQRIAAIQQQAI